MNNKDKLDEIKRKAPARPKTAAAQGDETSVPSSDDLTTRIAHLVQGQEEMARRIQSLSNSYNIAMNELQSLNRKVDEHSRLFNNMVLPNRRNYIEESGLDPALRQHHPQMLEHGNHGLSMHPDEGFPGSHSSSSNNNNPVHNAITPIEQAQRFLKSAPDNNGATKDIKPIPVAPGLHTNIPQNLSHEQMSPLAHSVHGNAGFPYNGGAYSVDGPSPQVDPAAIMDFSTPSPQFGLGVNGMDVAARKRFRPLAARKKSSGLNARWIRKPHILLVEDDPTCRTIGKKFLLGSLCDSDTAVCNTFIYDMTWTNTY